MFLPVGGISNKKKKRPLTLACLILFLLFLFSFYLLYNKKPVYCVKLIQTCISLPFCCSQSTSTEYSAR